jgi:hypothetical protein
MMEKLVKLNTLCFLFLLTCFLVACGEEEPTPTPTATPAPTEIAAPPTPQQAESPLQPTRTATAPAAAVSPLLTATEGVTPTEAMTAASVGTGTVAPSTTISASLNCSIQPDLDLAGYENLETQMGCPVEEALFDPVGINEFGEGPEYDRFMLWLSNESRIYVLLPTGEWDVYEDTWSEDQPTFTCNPLGEEEDSPPLPRRGFGKVWCTVEGLAEIMGPVPREERLCQHTVVQRFERGRLLACYEDATIRYIRLLDDGTWDTVLTR